MKILLTTDTVGGVWTYAIELARALRSRGVEVALATMGAPMSADQQRQVSLLDNVTVFASEFKLEWMRDPWDDVAAAGKWLLQLEAQVRPNVVHLNGYAHGVLPFAAPVVVGAHSCVLSWWAAVRHELAPMPQWQTYRHKVGQGLHAADVVVAPSKSMLDAIQRHYGPLPGARVIHNSRDPAMFHSSSIREPFILSAGRLWDPAKNLAALEQVAPQVSWPIRVAGDQQSPDESGGGHACAGARNVDCLGHLPQWNLAQLMSRAAIYALPARYEPFGLSALEAALSGCALVLGDIPSLREIWKDAAVFVEPEDTTALGSALRELIANRSQRDELAQRAQRQAREYSPDRMVESYLSLYRQLIRRSALQPEQAASVAAGPFAG